MALRASAALVLLLVAPPLSAGWDGLLRAAGLSRAGLNILEGASPEAAVLGIVPGPETVNVRAVVDQTNPKIQIIWAEQARVPVFRLPPAARVFAAERWTGAPLAAGWEDRGRIHFWTATPIGDQGYERYPYLVQSLRSLGLMPLAEARDLWAFFDSSYRLRADPGYLARLWRRGGIAGLHVAAWHYWEPDGTRDHYLRALIDACHRNAIAVYAWLEFPHVSEEFWNRNPAWREKTGTGQDAHLDWRRLMNLADPECDRAVNAALESLVARFDWDGVNLGELYFESLEGYPNPARFTPFNGAVRKEFVERHGFDPVELYDPASPRHHLRDGRYMRLFLDERANWAERLQKRWLDRLNVLRASRPGLDLVLTHIDDRFDATMRDKLGADAARLMPAAEGAGATFLIEDPATVWHLGPSRYTEIARKYKDLTRRADLLAIDLNIVERYQDVYPTKQQTGGELLLLIRRAAEALHRVALYFENSIQSADWPLLAASAAADVRIQSASTEETQIEAGRQVSVFWKGCAEVNGSFWPVGGDERILLPAGRWRVRRCGERRQRPIADFNGTLLEVRRRSGGWSILYESRSRAIALRHREDAPSEVVYLPAGRQETIWPD